MNRKADSRVESAEAYSRARKAKLMGFALTGVLAGIAVSGCATSAHPAAHSASMAEEALAKGKHRPAIELAEATVLGAPRNAEYRATLGAAYLDAGRFASASTAFSDAVALGDQSSRTALSLALADIAQGNYADAQRVLEASQDKIAASDLGLAYSLAGDPEHGIDILTATLRGGENTAKVRQNLAYSFALAGRWREARLMAAEDVPGDQLSNRIGEWAALVQPEAYRQRIAGLLSVPSLAKDPGQPAQLALANFPSTDQLAAEAQSSTAPAAPAPAAPAAPVDLAANVPAPAAPQSASNELPPIGDPVDASVAAAPVPAAQPVAVAQPVAPQRSAAAAPSSFAHAFATTAPANAQHFTYKKVAKPEIAASFKPGKENVRHPAPAAGTHLVQLGSFSSPDSAHRAWGLFLKRYPSLHNHQLVITKAVVNGKNYWRVAASGYDAGSSRTMCGRVKSGCLAYAVGRPLPGGAQTAEHLASR